MDSFLSSPSAYTDALFGISPTHAPFTYTQLTRSLPSTHTTHYRSTKKASEKTAHKYVSILTEFEFAFTVTRQTATHSTSVFHAFLKKSLCVSAEGGFRIQLRQPMAKITIAQSII